MVAMSNPSAFVSRCRSLKRGSLSHRELVELASKRRQTQVPAVVLTAPDAYDALVYDGDLEVDGDLSTREIKATRLFVTGDLSVAGTFSDTDDPETYTVVFGDMKARDVLTNGWLEVHGDLTVRQTLAGFYNDCSASIGGNLGARLFFPETHYFDVGGDLNVEHVVGYDSNYRIPERLQAAVVPVEDGRAMVDLLVREVLDPKPEELEEDEEPILDTAVLFARVRAGLPILK